MEKWKHNLKPKKGASFDGLIKNQKEKKKKLLWPFISSYTEKVDKIISEQINSKKFTQKV